MEKSFWKPADNLQKSVERENEYMIHDNDPLVNRFISVPDKWDVGLCCIYGWDYRWGLEASGFRPMRYVQSLSRWKMVLKSVKPFSLLILVKML